MVQVVSAEIFNLPPNVTGHVTYKTTLTKKGIWALTVGIVDPGWAGPLTTSLLNFSKVDYVISPGAAFLRVSFFQHHAVHDKYIEAKVNLEDYISDAREKAATRLPKTFLNTDKIVEQASNVILGRIVNYAMIWIGVISFFFAVSEFMKNIDTQAETKQSLSDYSQLQKRIDSLQYQIIRLSGNKMTH